MGKNKYSTFFFKEYAGIAEKNTYSAYVPSDGKGLWVQVIDNEIEENFARSGVEAIVERYMENSIFSMENMNEFLNAANKRIIESKIRKGRDYSQEFSVLVVIAEKNEMIVGNIGSTKFKIFRENEIYEELSGNKIKSLELKKNDYILIGSPKFWETINENEILDMLIRSDSRKELEKSLSEKIEEMEKLRGIPIPFISVFIEDLEEKESEIVITEIRGRKISPLKYLLVLLIFLFLFIVIGKTIQNSGYVKKAKEYIRLSEENFKNKKFKEAMNGLDVAISYYKRINPQNAQIKMEIENLEKKKEIAKREEENLLSNINSIKAQFTLTKIPEVVTESSNNDEKKEKKKEEYTVKSEISSIGTSVSVSDPVKRKNNVKQVKKSEIFQNVKKSGRNYSDLDEEIQRNWKILGRDENGNKK